MDSIHSAERIQGIPRKGFKYFMVYINFSIYNDIKNSGNTIQDPHWIRNSCHHLFSSGNNFMQYFKGVDYSFKNDNITD